MGKPEGRAQDSGTEVLEDQFRVLMYCIKCNLGFPPVVVVGCHINIAEPLPIALKGAQSFLLI